MKNKGFSLIEIIVAVSVLVIMAGIAVPVVSSQIDKAKAGKIITMADNLKKACEQYNMDTGAYAREYSTRSESRHHMLSVEQNNVSNWDGPYIDHPLNASDNPFGGAVYLLNNYGAGIDLLGDGNADYQGSGNYLYMTGVPQKIAERIDEIMDNGVNGNWAATGRVIFPNNRLIIYLCGGDN